MGIRSSNLLHQLLHHHILLHQQELQRKERGFKLYATIAWLSLYQMLIR